MKRAIVFGGSGFIGSHVADALSKEGFQVTVFDIKPSPYLNKEQTFILGDILEAGAVEKALAGHQIVYNFAGEADIDVSLEKPVETVTKNVIGSMNILESCRRQRVERFIYASTIYVYSSSGSFYRSSKQATELFIEDYHKHFGLDFTILRYGTLYGPRADERNWLYCALRQALKEKKIIRRGDGEELREYVHVYDAARLSVKVLSPEYKNEYVIIAGNQQIRIKDLMMMIREILHNKIELSFTSSQNDYHYEITPYNFSPKLAKKIISDYYIDLGQGILDMLNRIHKEDCLS